MMTNLQFINIFSDEIDSAIDSCENAMKHCGLEDRIDDMNDEAFEFLKQEGRFDNITNSVIYAYFSTTMLFIEEYANKKYEPDYYVNGYDSYFYVNGEEM